MLSINKVKFIKSLEHKKYRRINQCFVVEGEKMVNELMDSSLEITDIFALSSFIHIHLKGDQKSYIVTEISESELKKISFLQTPNQVLAIAKIPDQLPLEINPSELILALDGIQDPGNLGTIIRTAAWFGISHLFCSPETVDVYNPKVIQSTMGAIFRVQVLYSPLIEIIHEAKKKGVSVFGTLLTGNNIYNQILPKSALLVMGNESKGISTELKNLLDFEILIPSFPENTSIVESLNVSVATALVCAEFRRQQLIQP